MNKKGISVLLYPLIVIIMIMFFIFGIFLFIGLSKVHERIEERQLEKNEEIKENLRVYLYNGTITRDGWHNSSNTNILIVNIGGYDTTIDYFYISSKNGSLWIKGKMNLEIKKGCRENIILNMLGLPSCMNNWKNFEKNVELIAFHAINGNLFISKYEIPSLEEAIPPE